MLRTVVKRIGRAVVRGEIDNTVEGRTTGWLWLLGRAEPVALDLAGDCWRDLAGSRLRFVNPEPDRFDELDGRQRGVVGDMTASRKRRMPAISFEEYLESDNLVEFPPDVWRNLLSLEWFSETDGRVLIESADFELELGEPAWRMARGAEDKRKLANLRAMRDYMTGRIAATGSPPTGDDEVDWERVLRQNDRLNQAYQEVADKYLHDPDADWKEAFVMGWDGILEALSAAAPDGLEIDDGEIDEDESDDRLAWRESEPDGDSGDDDDDGHPLLAEALELAGVAFETLDMDDPRAAEVADMIGLGAARLAGALNAAYTRETGFVLALLKRCIALQTATLAEFPGLLARIADGDERRAVEALRDALHDLCGRIAEMRRELRGP